MFMDVVKIFFTDEDMDYYFLFEGAQIGFFCEKDGIASALMNENVKSSISENDRLVLRFLADDPGTCYTREEIARACQLNGVNAVKNSIYRLRKLYPILGKNIETVHLKGYRLSKSIKVIKKGDSINGNNDDGNFGEFEETIDSFYIRQVRPYKKGDQGMIYRAQGKYGETYSIKKFEKISAPIPYPYILTDENLLKTMMYLTLKQYNLTIIRGRDINSRCLIMDFVEGITLQQYIQGERISIGSVVHILSEILKGLDVLHKKSIVHGDITLSNVIMNNRNPILIDYGMTGFAGAKQLMTMIHHEYGCPEREKNLPLDYRSDIYGAGMVLRELVENVKTLHDDGPIFAGKQKLYEIAGTAMKLDPSERYQTAEEMLDAVLATEIPITEKGNYMGCDEEDIEIYRGEKTICSFDDVFTDDNLFDD